jgi:hypothetical protein
LKESRLKKKMSRTLSIVSIVLLSIIISIEIGFIIKQALYSAPVGPPGNQGDQGLPEDVIP